MMSDLISKQDAVVRIVDSAIDNILSGKHALTKEYEQAVHDSVRVILKALPSAQPENERTVI